jgi:uncharacterized protein (DUF1800 family)
MKRLLPVLAAALIAGLFHGDAAGPFDQKLPKDRQILHALNRLTFGPRPGDVEEVRKLGVEAWIDLQLHPERIPENPVLEAKLKPLASLNMDPGAILKEYPVTPPALLALNRMVPPAQLAGSPQQLSKITNGTLEERKQALDSLDPEKRQQLMGEIAPQQFAAFPELKKEADDARKVMQDKQQAERRRIMPNLNDLLSPDQVQVAQRGNTEQLQALFDYTDPAKRQQLAAALPPQALAEMPEMRRLGMLLRQPQQVIDSDLKEGKVYRAVYSNRQLEEVLTDFWFNHFNVFASKNVQGIPNAMRPVLADYEREAIRPHVLGHFKDLLLATARHPAMLYFLDNWQSIAPEAMDSLEVGPFAVNVGMIQSLARQAHGLNENYGRELMELHTLGVDGGYTQDDVIAVARCFTGWTIKDPRNDPAFVFSKFMHDQGEKTVLGHTISAGGGEQDGLQVIDILSRHPSTARFISKELAQRFVADDPPPALVDRMAQTFQKTDGDLRAVLATMFASPEFFSEGAWQAKMKSPLELVVSAVRSLGADVLDTTTLAQRIGDLGEPLYNKLEPTGYPNTGAVWMNTAGLLGRINFSTALVSGQVPGVRVDGARLEAKDVAAIARDLLGRDASDQTRAAIDEGLQGREPTPRLLAGLVIGSPDFQRR